VSAFKASKTVNALPGVLEASTLYLVRAGSGFDAWLTNEAGLVVAYPLNNPGKAGVATMVLPNGAGVLEWTQTIAAAGIAATDRIMAWLAPGSDGDENTADMIDLVTQGAVAAADAITFTLTLSAPLSGPVLINWKVI
jgi:hypothetical protein